MNIDFTWQWHKWAAITCIVFGAKKKATDIFTDMLARDPKDVYALSSLAHLKAESGDQAGAVSVYQRLVSDERAPVSAWFNLGYLQQELGHLSDAESSFRRA